MEEKKIKKEKNPSVIFRGEDNSYYEKFTLSGEVKCIDEEIPFEIPNGWEWCRLGLIGDWGAGATPLRGNIEYYGGKIPWLKTGELNNGLIISTEEYITDKALEECSLRLCNVGDILIAMYGATIGKLGIVGIKLTTNQACCACTPIFIYNKFLFYFLMASKQNFIEQGEGGAQPNISRIKLVNYLFPLPPFKRATTYCK
ncbi:restriction endonuclease subunit S [Capnocytophaga endodontalis]|uniref:restriction endonuclease subunit S n=1 Tax=Capnocytophaga endodontalis TaxID=2708117 RepID=UPI001D040A89|nr:restriction endonuclease subunit S [Capnocytophaga endodontalis]